MNSNTSSLTCAVAATLLACSAPAFAQTAPILLSFDSPNGLGAAGVLYDQGWSLTLRADTPNSLYHVTRTGLVAPRAFGDNEFVVLTDPDNCLDLRSRNGGIPFTAGCPGGADEEVLDVYVDEYDAPGVLDQVGRMGPPLSGVCRGSGALANPAFHETLLSRVQSHDFGMPSAPPTTRNEGPVTGPDPAAGQDCYGFGQDDDLPGLVIMADVAGARFYTPNFDPVPQGVRNLAGLLTNVTLEMSGARGTSVVATLIAHRRILDPLVMIDAEVTRKPWIGYDFLQRIDGGPIQGRFFSTPRPGPGDITGLTNAIANSLPIKRVVVRAVIVRDRAPHVIEDRNGDRQYTAADLELMGHTLLSNEAVIAIRATPASRLDDADAGCPVPTLMYNDLDGDGGSGTTCMTGSSNSKVRVPR